MYTKEFNEILKSDKINNFWLLRGAEIFELDLYEDILLKKFSPNLITKLYFNDYNLEDAKNAIAPSLFFGKNALVIRHNKTISTKDIKNIISSLNENTFFIFVLEEINKTNLDFIKAFRGFDVRFFKPNNKFEAIKLLCDIANSLKVKFSEVAIEKIYTINEENLSLSFCEIKKFANLGIELNIENVKKMVFNLNEISYEDLIKKIINLKDFREDFFKILQSSNFNEIMLLNYLYAYFLKIFKIHLKFKSSGNINLVDILGYNPPKHIAEELKKDALRFKLKQFLEIFTLINECEFSLKTQNSIKKDIFLLSNLIKLQFLINK